MQICLLKGLLTPALLHCTPVPCYLQVMNNQSYTNAAQALSQYFKILAKRRHPYDSAADEIELAINTRRTQVAQHTRHLHATPPAAAENGQHMQRTPTSSAEPAVPQEGGASGAHEAEM